VQMIRKQRLRRLQRLEARILDHHCLIPNTPQWLEFWAKRSTAVFAFLKGTREIIIKVEMGAPL
jgi:hypothetical protein